MGLGYVIVYAFFATLLYPGVNLPLTVVFSLLPGFLYSAIYYLLTVAMPRTGGDYVWISRIVNAPLGFVGNLLITFALITTNGVVAAWIVHLRSRAHVCRTRPGNLKPRHGEPGEHGLHTSN